MNKSANKQTNEYIRRQVTLRDAVENVTPVTLVAQTARQRHTLHHFELRHVSTDVQSELIIHLEWKDIASFLLTLHKNVFNR